MAYLGSTQGSSVANPPVAIASMRAGSTNTGSSDATATTLWMYRSTHIHAGIEGAGFITDGQFLGMSLNDVVIAISHTEGVSIHAVKTVTSTGIDLSTRGRDIAVLFGDGAGAVVLTATEEEGRGVLSTHIHSDGRYAEMLWGEFSSSKHHPRITAEAIEQGLHVICDKPLTTNLGEALDLVRLVSDRNAIFCLTQTASLEKEIGNRIS